MNELPNRPLKILLAAVEPSGDALGAALYRELKSRTPASTEFFGCGGHEMEKAGFESAFPTDAFSIIGLTGFIKSIPEGVRRAKEIGQLAAERNADVGIYIDGWAFSWRAARYTKRFSPKTKTVKYAAPQIWASRPGRVSTVKAYFDSVLTLLPFEPPYFRSAGMNAEFVGNPNFQSVYHQPVDETAFRERYGLADDRVIAVLPGSRKAEITQLGDVFVEVMNRVARECPDTTFIIPPAPNVDALVREKFCDFKGKLHFIDPEQRFTGFRVADVALAASGTVTTEIAIAQTPMVIAYKVDPLTFIWARSVTTTEYVSILNNAAGREVIPEYLQGDCTPDMITPAILSLLNKPEVRQRQSDAFDRLLDALAINQAPAAERAAGLVLDLISDS